MLLTRSALHGLPDPAPLIDNVLDQGTVRAAVRLSQPRYKTFIALDWAASVATGRAWQGRAPIGAASSTSPPKARSGSKAASMRGRSAGKPPLPTTTSTSCPGRSTCTAPRRGQPGRAHRLERLRPRCARLAGPLHGRRRGKLRQRHRRRRRPPVQTARRHPPPARRHHSASTTPARTAKPYAAPQHTKPASTPCTKPTRDGGVVTLERTKRRDGPESDHHELKLDPIDGTGSAAHFSPPGGGETRTRGADFSPLSSTTSPPPAQTRPNYAK